MRRLQTFNPTSARVFVALASFFSGGVPVALAAELQNGSFTAGLSGWVVGEHGATAEPGEVIAAAGAAELREQTSFLVTLSQEFELPKYAVTLRFVVEDPPGFFGRGDGIPDVFEAALLGADDRTLVPTWRPGGTAFFGVDQDELTSVGATATSTGGVVTLDVSTIASGTPVRLVFSLVGGDDDTESVVRVSGVTFDLSNRPPVVNAGADVVAECGSTVTLLAKSTDPDGDTLTHVWQNSTGDTVGEGPSFSFNQALGTETYVLVSTDSAGESGTAAVSVDVVDTAAPSILTAPVAALEADSACSAGLPDLLPASSAEDSCGDADLEQFPEAGTAVTAGDHDITLTATDAAGNVSTRIVTVSVVDTTAPVIVQVFGAGTAAVGSDCTVPAAVLTVDAFDNCTAYDDLIVTPDVAPGTPLGLGQTPLGVTVTDAAGNFDLAAGLVDAVDATAPTATRGTPDPVVASANTCTAPAPDLRSLLTLDDNCTPASAIVANPTVTPGTILPVGFTNIPFELVDAAGNQGQSSILVTVIDTTPPTLVAPSSVEVVADSVCGGTVPAVSAQATDACGLLGVYQQPPAGSLLELGTPVTVTIRAMDEAGSTSIRETVVTLVDRTPPVVTGPASTSVATDASCVAVLPEVSGLVDATDNCTAVGDLARTQTGAAGTPFAFGVATTVVAKIVDGAGNAGTHTLDVSSTDGVAPVVTLPATVFADVFSGCSGSVPVLAEIATITEGCTPRVALGITQDVPSGTTLAADESRSVTLTVVDSSGNVGTATTEVVGKAAGAPSINLPERVDVTANDACGGAVPNLVPEVLGGCGGVTLAQLPLAGTALTLGQPVSVTVTATDALGGSFSDTAEVGLVDVTAPELHGQTSWVALVDGMCAAVAPDLTLGATVTDNCPLPDGVAVTASIETGAALANGAPTPGELSAKDASGNLGALPVSITTSDTLPPSLTLLSGDALVQADAACAGGVPKVAFSVLDNCDPTAVVTQSPAVGAPLSLGVATTVTVHAMDASGAVATKTVMVNLVDQMPPTAPSLGAQSVDAGATCSAATPTLSPSATDNCGGVVTNTQVPPAGAALTLGQHAVVVTLEDAAGNTSEVSTLVTVVDASPPTLTLGSGPTLVLADAACSGQVPDFLSDEGLLAEYVTVNDNCPGVVVTQVPEAGAALTLGAPTTVTITAQSPSGHTVSLPAEVSLVDKTPPVGPAIAAQTVEVDSACVASAPVVALAPTDNCGTVTQSQVPAAGASLSPGQHTVVVTLQDAAGNTSDASAIVNVVDAVPPVLTVLSGPTLVTADATCSGQVPDFLSDTGGLSDFVTASDNCTGLVVTQSPPAGSALILGMTEVTITATSPAGHAVSAPTRVDLVDKTPPTPSPIANQIAEVDAVCVALAPVLSGASTDNCGPVTLSQVPAVGAPLVLGLNPFVVTFEDGSGNSAEVAAVVDARDATPPGVVLPDPLLLQANAVCEAAFPTLRDLATLTDNCAEAVALTATQTPTATVIVTPDSADTATLEVTDPSGNKTTVTVAVTVSKPEGSCGDQPLNPDEDEDVSDNPLNPDAGSDSGDTGPVPGSDVSATGDVVSSEDVADDSEDTGAGQPVGLEGCSCRLGESRPPPSGGVLVGLLFLLVVGFRRT